jgi:hypothetical protein
VVIKNPHENRVTQRMDTCVSPLLRVAESSSN